MGDLVAATPGRYGPAVVWLLRSSTSDHTDAIVQAACTSGDMPDSVGPRATRSRECFLSTITSAVTTSFEVRAALPVTSA